MIHGYKSEAIEEVSVCVDTSFHFHFPFPQAYDSVQVIGVRGKKPLQPIDNYRCLEQIVCRRTVIFMSIHGAQTIQYAVPRGAGRTGLTTFAVCYVLSLRYVPFDLPPPPPI